MDHVSACDMAASARATASRGCNSLLRDCLRRQSEGNGIPHKQAPSEVLVDFSVSDCLRDDSLKKGASAASPSVPLSPTLCILGLESCVQSPGQVTSGRGASDGI